MVATEKVQIDLKEVNSAFGRVNKMHALKKRSLKIY